MRMLWVLGMIGLLLFGSINLDPRIISISNSNGVTWLNPNATKFVHNAACADTQSRLAEVCAAFCSSSMKYKYKIRLQYHQYSQSHFDLQRNYPVHWAGWNFTTKEAQRYDRKWIAFYQKLLDSCNICAGITTTNPQIIVVSK